MNRPETGAGPTATSHAPGRSAGAGVTCARGRRLAGGFALAAMALVAANAGAQAPDRAKLRTNQDYVEEVTRATTLDVKDKLAVFAYVFGELPDRVKVYPTENYYYFSFAHNGTPYGGNIRLDASDRDEGKVHFAYAEDLTDWGEDTPAAYVRLDASHGVQVEKLERFAYRVTFRQKSVVFQLNDLLEAKPPPPVLASDEIFIGPVFDESATRFFLVFNSKLKIFLYILDETVPVAEQLGARRRRERILIGKRTGFAFYRDHRLNRKILIGVYEGNVRVNNFFDGPFDQMPDNFHEGETFRQALYALDPNLKGEIDRFGAFSDGVRYAIVPYMHYRNVRDLDVFHRCATSKRIPTAAYHRCFVLALGPERGAKARPLAMPPRTR